MTFPVPVFSMLARPSRRDQNVCTYCTARQTFLPQGRKLEGVSALSLLSDKKLCLIFIDSFLCWLILRLICYEIESSPCPTRPTCGYQTVVRAGHAVIPGLPDHTPLTTWTSSSSNPTWRMETDLRELSTRKEINCPSFDLPLPPPLSCLNICLGLSDSMFG